MDPQWLIEQFEERCYELQFLESGLDDLKQQFSSQLRLGDEYIEQTTQQCSSLQERLAELVKAHKQRLDALGRVRDRLIDNQQLCQSHYQNCNDQVDLSHRLVDKWIQQEDKAREWKSRASKQLDHTANKRARATHSLNNAKDDLSNAQARLRTKLSQKVPVTYRRNDGSSYIVYETPDASYERGLVQSAESDLSVAKSGYQNAIAAHDSAKNNYNAASEQLTAATSSLGSAKRGKSSATDALSQATDSLKDAQSSVEGIEDVVKRTMETAGELLERFKSNVDEQQMVLQQTHTQHAQVSQQFGRLYEEHDNHLKSAGMLQYILNVKTEQLETFDYTE
jgi:uncharacterized protein with PIN domain